MRPPDDTALATSPEASELLTAVRTLDPASATPAVVRSLARSLLEHPPPSLVPLELRWLASFNTEPLDPYLHVEAARLGFRLRLVRGGFGEIETALLDLAPTASTERSVLVVSLRPDDLDLDAYARFLCPAPSSSEPKDAAPRFAPLLDRLLEVADLYRARGRSGPVLLANLAAPAVAPQGVFEASSPSSLSFALAAHNLALARATAERPGVFVWDFAGLVASAGTTSFTDPRMWALSRAVVGSKHLASTAAHLLRTVRGVVMPPAKCLVLDLDHTLWGGAVGDVGIAGIQLGDDFPGNTYKALQRAALGLRDRGILLAIASKNDPEVARAAIDTHPEMLLRCDDFAAIRIGWGPKSQSLIEIAQELNLGLDALVFFDDNPVERAEVRAHAPAVRVLEVPTDPVRYVEALAAAVDFDAPRLTEEDLGRAESYQADRARARAQVVAPSMDDFLGSLDMIAEVGTLDPGTTHRVAQLVDKTNQFNLTLRRHPQAELVRLAETGVVTWLRLRDRFGDLGLVAVAALRFEGPVAIVDTFVMSCRVAQRRVEQALASHLCATAKARGCSELVGEYTAGPRNHVVADLWPSLGFQAKSSEPPVARFGLDLTSQTVPWPNGLRRLET